MHRDHRIDLWDAYRTWPWRKLEPLLRAPAWSMTDENIARRLDLETFYVEHEYAGWTVDPEDPDVVAERERRKRLGIKPPARPVIFPAAQRPADRMSVLLDRYVAEQQAADTPTRPEGISGPVGSDLFDLALGL